MAAAQDPPLDEIQWRAPELVQQMGGIHTNTGQENEYQEDTELRAVLHYFAQSPFFDATSNNAALATQAMYNASLAEVVGYRRSFEERLRSMQGLEFVVVQDPSEDDTKTEHSGVWVIRKQLRRKGDAGGNDNVTALSLYFVVGENVYMAPSVGSIMQTRLLAAVCSLTDMLSIAQTMPSYTPAEGYSYLPDKKIEEESSTGVEDATKADEEMHNRLFEQALYNISTDSTGLVERLLKDNALTTTDESTVNPVTPMTEHIGEQDDAAGQARRVPTPAKGLEGPLITPREKKARRKSKGGSLAPSRVSTPVNGESIPATPA